MADKGLEEVPEGMSRFRSAHVSIETDVQTDRRSLATAE